MIRCEVRTAKQFSSDTNGALIWPGIFGRLPVAEPFKLFLNSWDSFSCQEILVFPQETESVRRTTEEEFHMVIHAEEKILVAQGT